MFTIEHLCNIKNVLFFYKIFMLLFWVQFYNFDKDFDMKISNIYFMSGIYLFITL